MSDCKKLGQFPMTISEIDSYVDHRGRLVYILTLSSRGMKFRVKKIFRDDSDALGYEVGSAVDLDVVITQQDSLI